MQIFLSLYIWLWSYHGTGSPKVSSVQFSSVAQSYPTLCDPMNCSTPGLPVHHQLPESTQTHVHWVSDAIQPSHPLLSPSHPALKLSQHQGLFQWVSSSHQVAKVLEFQLQHQSFQWTPRTVLQKSKQIFEILVLKTDCLKNWHPLSLEPNNLSPQNMQFCLKRIMWCVAPLLLHSISPSSNIQNQSVLLADYQNFLVYFWLCTIFPFYSSCCIWSVLMSGEQRGALGTQQRGQFGSVWNWVSFIPVMACSHCTATVHNAHLSEDVLSPLPGGSRTLLGQWIGG